MTEHHCTVNRLLHAEFQSFNSVTGEGGVSDEKNELPITPPFQLIQEFDFLMYNTIFYSQLIHSKDIIFEIFTHEP